MAKKKNAESKNKNLPFAVLRKGALFALLGTTVLGGGLLAGCDEVPGSVSVPAGTSIYWGEEDPSPTENPGKVGDYYIETDDGDVWQLTAEGWEPIDNFNIKGPQGAPGKTSTISISNDGYWVINGIKSEVKAEGRDGQNAQAPVIEINDDGYWTVDGVSTGVLAKGDNGETGKSAFDLAVEHEDFEGTVAEWLESLKGKEGKEGKQGYYVTSIREVVDDVWGISSHFEFTLNDEAKTVVSTQSVSRLMPNYYYGATTGAEFIELIELGAENIQIENDIELTSALTINHDLGIDLNNHKLTYNCENNDYKQVVIDDGIQVEFKDGEMDFTAKNCTASSLKVQGGASLILDNVEYVSTGTNVMVIENATSVKVVDSHLTGAVYCVGTNALTEENFGVKIEIDDCEFDTTGYEYKGEMWYDTTPILINIPCTATIKDSKITGHRQAVIVRGGDVVIENCKLINTGKDLYIKGLGMKYNMMDPENIVTWGQGNEVAMATLVVGNDNTGIYSNYATNLTLTDVQIISQKVSLGIPTIWAEGNEGENLGVTITYGGTGLDEDTMTTTYVGQNVKVEVEADSYEMFRSLVYTAMGTNGQIAPKLTHDILAYGADIGVREYIGFMQIREYAEQLGLLTEFDIWTMFDINDVRVSSVEDLMLAVTPVEYGGLGLTYSQVALAHDICLDDEYIDMVPEGEQLPIEALLEIDEINNQLKPGGRFVLNIVNTHDAVVYSAEGLQAAVNTYNSHRVTLLSDINFEGAGLVVGKDAYVEIDLNEFTISNAEPIWDKTNRVWSLISVDGGHLTIKNGNVNGLDGDCYAIDIRNGGTCVIESGEYIGNVHAVYVYEGNLFVRGGLFDIQQLSEVTGDSRYTLNCYDANYKNETATILVEGGTFANYDPNGSTSEYPTADFVPSGYVVIPSEEDMNGDVWYTVVPGLNQLLANTQYGETLVLENDIILTDESADAKTIIDTDATINFADSVLNLNIPDATSATANWSGINVNGGNVVFEGNNGGVVTAANGELYAVTIRNGANLTINGGTYIGGTTSINVVQGTLTINGGFFASRIDGEDDANGRWTINCYDANYRDGSAVVIITGGTFVNFNPEDNLCEGQGTNYVAEGYKVIEQRQENGDIWYTVVAE